MKRQRQTDSCRRATGARAVLFLAGFMLGTGTDARDFERAVTLGDDEIRIQEVFTSHLPDTIERNAFRASLHPRFGDLRDRDYLRVFLGLRYGLTERLEVSAGSDTYFSHGAGELGLFDDAGVSRVQLGAKLNVGTMLLNAWHSSIGFEAWLPVGNPPPGLHDGLRHVTPYVALSRRLDSHPHIRVFWGVGLDLIEKADYEGTLGTNQLDEDTVDISAGIVWDRHKLHYLVETHWMTTDLIGETSENVFTVRPGIIWEVPGLRDSKRPSGWLVGVAGDLNFGPDGDSIGASAKLRYNFDLKRLFFGNSRRD